MKLFDRMIAGVLPAVPKALVRQFAKPYVAGETLDEAIEAVRGINAQGMMATLDLLGEDTTRPEEAAAARDQYVVMLERIAAEGVDSNVSLKLTQIGLKLDPKLALDNLRAVVAAAKASGNFVRIDMEDSSCTDVTLATYAELRKQRLSNVGVVLQARLKRTLKDARKLARGKANVRVCKGIYIEPPALALTDRAAIRDNFMEAVKALLEKGSYVGIATHDELLVERARALVERLGLAREQYEFQMLYGVRPALGRRLVEQGQRLRIYVPFGSHWYAYSMRRLRENPEIAGYVMKSIARRG